MSAPQKIRRLYAWLVTEADGGEAIAAVHLANTLIPLVGADRARIEGHREDARELQRLTQTSHADLPPTGRVTAAA